MEHKKKGTKMSRKMIIVLPLVEEHNRKRIETAAAIRGFTVSCFADEQEALPQLAEAEVILGQSAALAENAPRLRWLCTPSAGVNQFTPGCFAIRPSISPSSIRSPLSLTWLSMRPSMITFPFSSHFA